MYIDTTADCEHLLEWKTSVVCYGDSPNKKASCSYTTRNGYTHNLEGLQTSVGFRKNYDYPIFNTS